jgi:hypothetical protein
MPYADWSLSFSLITCSFELAAQNRADWPSARMLNSYTAD